MSIKWTKINDNNWLINYKNKVFKCNSLEKLFVYSFSFGIKLNEIEYSVLELNRMNHNFCEFGVINKRFVFSKRIGNKNDTYPL